MLRKSCLLSAAFGLFVSGCAAILEEPRIDVEGDREAQEAVEISIEPLSSDVVRKLNGPEFPVQVTVNDGGREHVESAESIVALSPLPTKSPIPYTLGVGDQITLVRFVTERGFTDDIAQEKIINQTSRVSSDGGILFMETGPLQARGSTLAALREEVSNALIRNGIDPRFQLEVTGFNSQTVTLITNTPAGEAGDQVTVSVAESTKGTGLYPVTERPLSLRELLVQAGLKFSQDTLQVVEVLRDSRKYSMPVHYVFAPATPDYYLTGGDVVKFNEYTYKSFNAYALGGGSTPRQINLSPMKPVYLSDVLFAEDGILSTPAARKWDIYVLRGENPTRAYHLDATNPARLGIATELTVKPNDIVFASTKPIYDGGTILSLINPLNALLSGSSGN